MTVVDWLCSSFVHASPTSSSSKRADPRTRPLQMFAIFRRAGFHRCHADVCRRWSMGRPEWVRAFPSLAGNTCRHPPSPLVVGMFSFPAAPLTTVLVRGTGVLAVVRLHSAGALCCAARVLALGGNTSLHFQKTPKFRGHACSRTHSTDARTPATQHEHGVNSTFPRARLCCGPLRRAGVGEQQGAGPAQHQHCGRRFEDEVRCRH